MKNPILNTLGIDEMSINEMETVYGGNNEAISTQSIVAVTLLGVATGGSCGSMLGPFGLLIGAAAGGLLAVGPLLIAKFG